MHHDSDYGPPPSEDGSCNCGALVLTTGSDPCPFCGGYTLAQLQGGCGPEDPEDER